MSEILPPLTCKEAPFCIKVSENVLLILNDKNNGYKMFMEFNLPTKKMVVTIYAH